MLARTSAPKPSRWPRTDRRRRRIESVLSRRQPDLTVVLENVHDPHNVSAVLRSCDAVGILRIHVVYSVEAPPERAYARTTSASAAKWIDVVRHDTIEACYAALHEERFAVIAASLGDRGRDLFALDLTQPTAIVFGNEMRGLSEHAIALADSSVVIPMMGMVQSLNISVACAVTLYEALRQRFKNGDYGSSKLAQSESSGLVEEWLKR
ncbi:MAG: TrmH family RNA methyltransferase [Thermomicrobiales bacterium]